MEIEQKQWTAETGWKPATGKLSGSAHLVLAFGARAKLEDSATYPELKAMYPDAHVVSCSTAGEIHGAQVLDGSLSVTAVRFRSSSVRACAESISDAAQSEEVGRKLGQCLPHEGLVHAMVFSDGLRVNGTRLVRGLAGALPKGVAVTGGLSGDGADFKKTLVGLDAPATEGQIVLVGLYGAQLRVGHGSLGGWDPFGPERVITRSEGNVLYEIDGKPALALYKEYLGDKAKDLPGSGLLFPLQVRLKEEEEEEEVTRTLLAVDEKAQSLTFAGDMPQGALARLMKANFDRLVDGASGAGKMGIEGLDNGQAELAVLVSCVGRKLVLKERVEEEIEAVRAAVGEQAASCGFYSYGEISPSAATEKQCRLHNQTMTVTTLREA
ncbi:hypothetical protein EPO34_01700 [Patescibacteria group bacterium]|nr:MAG: hypothetical protein EPO34_01700 [Patescibacteria group bacterium]